MHPSPAKRSRTNTRLVFLLLVALLPAEAFLFFLPGPTGSAQPSDVSADEILTLSNSERAKEHIRALRHNQELDNAAVLKASDMLRNGYFAHTSPQGNDFTTSIKKMGVEYAEAGENLAIDFIDSTTVVSSWMQSEDHRKNLLNPRFTDIGVATLSGKFNGNTTTVVVQLFARAPLPTH